MITSLLLLVVFTSSLSVADLKLSSSKSAAWVIAIEICRATALTKWRCESSNLLSGRASTLMTPIGFPSRVSSEARTLS